VVKYPIGAARALGFLKRYYNDVDIYIEDLTGHNMALFVFRKILGDAVRLTSVNQLGNKLDVIKACEIDQRDDGRRKLYIIDGDLDLLKGVPRPRLKHLYRLRVYCFENLLISEQAVIELASEVESNTPPHELQARLDHPAWMVGIGSRLISLFILYAVSSKLCPSVSTIGFNVHRLCTKTATGQVALSDEKVRARMRALARDCSAAAGLQAISTERRKIASRAAADGNPTRFMSGKDYLLPLLRLRLSFEIGFRGSLDELRVRLARHYDVAQEPLLARTLRSVAGA
jgi:Protein of unknown function (DUF4435)